MRRSRRRKTAGAVIGMMILVGSAALVLARPRARRSPTFVLPRRSAATTSRRARSLDPRPKAYPARVETIASSPHVMLGVPIDADPSDDYLIDERAYVVSYNPVREVPNWVSWRLDRSYLGHASRRNDFRPDPALPEGFYRVISHDYAYSGYDRGHMCPSGDRTDNAADNSLTFLMTNIQPQIHELNDGPWEKLEEYERRLAEESGAELYIVAGGIFGATYPRIGHGVAVPKANYKVIVVLRSGDTAAEVTPKTETIAVLMPNEPGVGVRTWTDFSTTIDEIERETGYDLLANVPENVQRVIESRAPRVP